ncbi:hypothetical protein Syun_014160 [Stephania yunnanensis]|uniref:Transmembrane protein n=1 Tax=Stephania yunnanensis TaxID=152371 RepID=A0AAP0PBJ3_9MAGN
MSSSRTLLVPFFSASIAIAIAVALFFFFVAILISLKRKVIVPTALDLPRALMLVVCGDVEGGVNIMGLQGEEAPSISTVLLVENYVVKPIKATGELLGLTESGDNDLDDETVSIYGQNGVFEVVVMVEDGVWWWWWSTSLVGYDIDDDHGGTELQIRTKK